jgi:GT2 family glycosyltransferase
VLYWREHELPLLERCVESLLAQDLSGADLRIFVIDNGCGLTPRLPPDVELIRLASNRGFTGGHNAGIRAALDAGAEYVFLVNSDVVVSRDCLVTLLDAARQSPAAGMFGPLVLSEDPADEIESAGLAFNRRTGRHRQLGRGLHAQGVGLVPYAVDSVSGCALLVRRTVVERVGMLDDALFFYFEDIDWCLRARTAGFGVRVVPAALVWHRGGGSTGPASPRTTFYSVRNHLVLAMRHRQQAPGWALAPLVVAYHLAFLLSSRERRSRAHVSALVRGALAASFARMGQQAKLAGSH